MAITLALLEIDRSDDQAIATLGATHWDLFFTEPRYGKYCVESRRHGTWRKGLRVLENAAAQLRAHAATVGIAA